MNLPELAPNLHAGDGLLMYWGHTPLHDWQDQQWLDMMKRELTPIKYSYMIENHFVGAEAAYITPEMFDRSVKELPPLPRKPVIFVAVDAGWKRDNAAVVAVTIDGDHIRFVYAKIFKPSPDDPLNFENTIEETLRYLHERYTIGCAGLIPRKWSI